MALDHQKSKPEDDAASAGSQESTNESSEPAVSLLLASGPADPPITPDTHNHTAQKTEQWRDNLKLGVEAIGLAALIVYTVFSVLQWAQIRWTNRLTREALNGNDVSLKQTLGKMQLQTDATNRLATASETANADSIARERAWLGLAIQVDGFQENGTATVTIVTINSGHRPAKITSSRVACREYQKLPADPAYRVDRKVGSTLILVPGAASTFVLPIDATFTRSGAIESLTDETKPGYHLFIYGRTDYREVGSKGSYVTKFCYTYVPATRNSKAGFYNCAEYNDAR